MPIGIDGLVNAIRTSMDNRHRLSVAQRRTAIDGLAEFGAGAMPADLDWCELGGVRAAQFLPNEAGHEEDSPGEAIVNATILYLHGGAFVAGSPRSHQNLTRRLSYHARARVVALDYRLAPEHQFPAAVEDVLAAYDALEQCGVSSIALVGDSAGATLALLAAIRLRDAGRRLPFAVGLMSPLGDLRCIDAHFDKNGPRDPMISRGNLKRDVACFLGSQDAAAPEVSPALADLTGLPPMLIQSSDCEALTGDAITLEERARQMGVDAKLELYPGMVHVWHLYPLFVTEANEAIKKMGIFIGRMALEARAGTA